MFQVLGPRGCRFEPWLGKNYKKKLKGKNYKKKLKKTKVKTKKKKEKKTKEKVKTKKKLKKRGKNTKIYFIIYQFKNECIYRPGYGNTNNDRDTGTQLQRGRRGGGTGEYINDDEDTGNV